MRPAWPVALLCALLLAPLCQSAEEAAAAAPPAAAAQGAADGVTWLVQLSDLHLSQHAWPTRCVARRACAMPWRGLRL